MTKKQTIFLFTFLLIAGIIYFFLYKDSFGSGGIQIFHRAGGNRARPQPRGRKVDPAAASILFGFNKKFGLTELQVIAVSDILTNKYPQAMWHLVSDSNSVPTKGFSYGEKIPGMRPKVEGLHAESLEHDVDYRLVIEAGSTHGEHDFKIPSQPGQ